MKSEHEVALEILTAQPDHKMALGDLARAMSNRRALGFGVEAIDVVHALQWEQKVIYNPDEESVTLAEPQVILNS
ncbi:MAG: hypothetical protein HYZ53_07890 [Planctomycetes bacterium]|nr:hypothetical protein [Planctomycetota bacterium]